MSIKVYNTLTKQKEEFVPIHPGKATSMFAVLLRTTIRMLVMRVRS